MIKLGELALLSFRCKDITNTRKRHDEFYVIMSLEARQEKVVDTWKQASDFLAADIYRSGILSRIPRALSHVIKGVPGRVG
jgi:hypothetical protein